MPLVVSVVTRPRVRRDAEVGQQGLAVGREQHVGRLHVAVEHPPPVGRRQRVGHRSGQRHDLARRQPAALGQQVVERPARRVLHGERHPVAVLDHLEHADDVRVVELREQRRLPPDAGQVRRPAARPQALERHDPGQRPAPVRPPHGAGRARADLALQLVVADGGHRRVLVRRQPPVGGHCRSPARQLPPAVWILVLTVMMSSLIIPSRSCTLCSASFVSGHSL